MIRSERNRRVVIVLSFFLKEAWYDAKCVYPLSWWYSIYDWILFAFLEDFVQIHSFLDYSAFAIQYIQFIRIKYIIRRVFFLSINFNLIVFYIEGEEQILDFYRDNYEIVESALYSPTFHSPYDTINIIQSRNINPYSLRMRLWIRTIRMTLLILFLCLFNVTHRLINKMIPTR